MKGKVYLVGAGPGDPELLTLKAVRVLQSADVVLHDELIGREVLAFASPTALIHNVGKRCGRKSIRQEEINPLLVRLAQSGMQVVRLKGGDPLVFGRGGEEMEALRRAKIEFEIVPGVTASLAAAAAAQIPLTQRGVASALVFLTSHHSGSDAHEDWSTHINSGATLVVYMPGYDYDSTARRLLAAGLKKKTPCIVVSRATTAEERVHRGTVGSLPLAPRLPAPTLLIVGEVAGLADHATATASLPHELRGLGSLAAGEQPDGLKIGQEQEPSA